MKTKAEIKDLVTQMVNLTNRINSIEKQFLDFKSNIAGRVLGNEISVEQAGNIKGSQLENIRNLILTHKNR